MTPARVKLAGVTALLLAASLGWARPAPARPTLLVYHALTRGFTAVDGLPAHPTTRAVDCPLGQWAVRVAVAGTQLVALDTEAKAIAVVDLPALAAGRCAVTRTPLAAAQVPYRGRLLGDRLYVVYFAGNIVEEYRWPERTLARTLRFDAGENLGLADVALLDGRLAVLATGYRCFQRRCPEGRFGPARLYFPEGRWPFPSLTAANVNASRIYQHTGQHSAPPAPASTWLLESGELEGGRSMLQRVAGDHLESPLLLPRAAGIATAFPLGRLFVVVQMLGEHLFLVDPARGRLERIARFDGARFVDVPRDAAELPERADAAFQDLVAEPGAPDRFYLVDRRGERLVHADAALRVLDVTSLRTPAFSSAPDWAVWASR